MAKKDFNEIKKEVKKLVSDIIELPENEISETARFAEDLAVDSMKALEIVAGIEKKYRVVIPENKIATIRTLTNLFELIEPLLIK